MSLWYILHINTFFMRKSHRTAKIRFYLQLGSVARFYDTIFQFSPNKVELNEWKQNNSDMHITKAESNTRKEKNALFTFPLLEKRFLFFSVFYDKKMPLKIKISALDGIEMTMRKNLGKNNVMNVQASNHRYCKSSLENGQFWNMHRAPHSIVQRLS